LVIGITIYVIVNNYLPSINEDILIDEYIEETSIDKTTNTSKTTKKRIINTTKKTTSKSEYLMILEIPKINLKKGIYYKDNKNNNVDHNIAILPSSSMPDEDKGSVILASHNGNTRVSYFKYLENLSNNDFVYLYYKGKKYQYSIYKSEIVDKVGTIKIKKDSSISNIVLISCKNGTKDKQIVYLGKLISIKDY
jgi:LPXTG-site transpeptidase (sortase) family protein